MNKVPSDLKYSKYSARHNIEMWVRVEADNHVVVGFTYDFRDYMEAVHFIRYLPKVGMKIAAGDDCAVVVCQALGEVPVYCPVSGEIIDIHQAMEDDCVEAGRIDDDPYGDGWLFRIKLDDAGELANLLDAEGYHNAMNEAYEGVD